MPKLGLISFHSLSRTQKTAVPKIPKIWITLVHLWNKKLKLKYERITVVNRPAAVGLAADWLCTVWWRLFGRGSVGSRGRSICRFICGCSNCSWSWVCNRYCLGFLWAALRRLVNWNKVTLLNNGYRIFHWDSIPWSYLGTKILLDSRSGNFLYCMLKVSRKWILKLERKIPICHVKILILPRSLMRK